MRLIVSLAVLLFLLPPSSVLGSPSIVGSWQFKNNQIEVVAEFLPDGTFQQVTTSAKGKETLSGRFQLSGQMLYLLPQGAQQPFSSCSAFPMPTLSWPHIHRVKPFNGNG